MLKNIKEKIRREPNYKIEFCQSWENWKPDVVFYFEGHGSQYPVLANCC